MVDDDASAREVFGQYLGGFAGAQLRIVEQDAAVAMLNTAAWKPDVLVLDIFLRGARTIDMLEAVKREWPGMTVVITAWAVQPYSHVYLRYGAHAFVDKSRGWAELDGLLRGLGAPVAAGVAEPGQRRLGGR